MAQHPLQVQPNPIECWVPYYIKTHLKSIGWTCPSSGDGTTYNSSGDQITHGGSGANGWNNTGAWARLRSPNSALEMTMQRNANSTTWRIKLARAAMNAGSPSATQTPATTTGTDEILVLGSGSDAAPVGSSWFGGGTSGGVHLKGCADDAAPYGFWFATSGIAGSVNSILCGFLLDPLTNTIPGDAFTYVMIARPQDLVAGQLSSGDTPANQFTYLASATPATAVNMPASTHFGISGTAIPGDIITVSDGQFREFLVRYERRAAAANPGYKGVSSLMRWVSPVPRRWFPLSTSVRIMYGDVSLPWTADEEVIA